MSSTFRAAPVTAPIDESLVRTLAGIAVLVFGGVAALLAWPHVDIARRGLSRVGMSFMAVNGVVGLLYGAVVIVATLWPSAGG